MKSKVRERVKILAFTDVHSSVSQLMRVKKKAKNSDIVVFAGDLTLFGAGLSKMMRLVSQLNKRVVMINGNHEGMDEMRHAALNYPNISFISGRHMVIDDILFIGYSKGCFSSRVSSFKSFKERMKRIIVRNKDKKLVFVTHAPPYGTTTDMIDSDHFGNRDIRDFIRELKPDVVVTGHLHEAFHARDLIGKTLIINPGPDGRIFYL